VEFKSQQGRVGLSVTGVRVCCFSYKKFTITFCRSNLLNKKTVKLRAFSGGRSRVCIPVQVSFARILILIGSWLLLFCNLTPPPFLPFVFLPFPSSFSGFERRLFSRKLKCCRFARCRTPFSRWQTAPNHRPEQLFGLMGFF